MLHPLYLGVGIREAAMFFMGYTCLAFTKYLKIVLLSDSIAELALGDGVLPCKQALTVLLNGYRLEHMLEDISVHFIRGLTHLSLQLVGSASLTSWRGVSDPLKGASHTKVHLKFYSSF